MKHSFLTLISIGAFIAGCGAPKAEPPSADSARPEKQLTVAVTILPQSYFVRRIAGDRARIVTLMERGGNDEVFEIKPRQMANLGDASLYFSIGANAEAAWLPRIRESYPGLKFIPTDNGIEKAPSIEHAHGDGSVEQSALDPHIWLSPRLVMLQAETIAEALLEADPGGEAMYRDGLRNFQKEISALNLELADILSDSTIPRAFVAYHPAWGYFARDYGFEQLSVEVEGKDPKPAHLEELIGEAKKKNVKVILVEPGMAGGTGASLATAIGAKVVVADHTGEDWPRALRAVAQALSGAAR